MKSKQNLLFLVFIVGLAGIYGQVFSYFKYHYSGIEEMKADQARLQRQVQEKEVISAWYKSQLIDFQNQVVSFFPDMKIKDAEADYFGRNIASVSAATVDSHKLDLPFAFEIMKQAKDEFKNKKYDESVKLLTTTIDRYPLSPYVVEAHFLLAESYYLQKNYSKSLDVIRTMMKVYPDNVLTGFIMLRMGQILNNRQESEQAKVVFETVLSNFDNIDLKKQTQKLISGLETNAVE